MYSLSGGRRLARQRASSDPTDTVQPRVLASFRNRFGVVATNEHAAAEMEQSKTHRARHKTRASLLSDQGLDAANHNRASGGGRSMFLTSPLYRTGFYTF